MDFYIQCGLILEKLDQKKGSIKSLTLSGDVKQPKRCFKLVCEVLKYRDVLQSVIDKSGLLTAERRLGQNLALLLAHELLLSKDGIIATKGIYMDAILRHKTRLSAELTRLLLHKKVKSVQELAKSSQTVLPRWFRINSLVAQQQEVLRSFSHLKKVFKLKDLQEGSIFEDNTIPNVFALHPSYDLIKSPHYRQGSIVLQDKASAFPAYILDPPPNATVVDTCAAPGNKTSHVASIQHERNGKGTIVAFEKDHARAATLRKLTTKARADVHVRKEDFLSCAFDDPMLAEASHFLVDPSCSGSGIVNRLDYLLDDAQAEVPSEEEGTGGADHTSERLKQLASFQEKIVMHAMQFPNASKVTYSTCSIHEIENECVVQAILSSTGAKGDEWSVAPRSMVIPDWTLRGHPRPFLDPENAEGCIRCEPGRDGTIGFFVCCFIKNKKVRKSDGKRVSNSTTLHMNRVKRGRTTD